VLSIIGSIALKRRSAEDYRRSSNLPSSRDLERLRQAHDSKAVRDLEQSIQLKEAVRTWDEWTRKVWLLDSTDIRGRKSEHNWA